MSLHRFLTNCPKGMCVDHIDGNTLDNRKSNLRVVDNATNMINRLQNRNSKLGIKGVTIHEPSGRYMAYIQSNKKRITIGYFDTIEEAKEARVNAEIKYFGYKVERGA